MPEETFGIKSINIDDASLDGDDLERIRDIYTTLAKYAQLRVNAMVARANCNMERTKHWESQCECTYNQLPESVRW